MVVRKASYGSSSSKDSIDKCESKETWTGSQDHLVLHLLLQHSAQRVLSHRGNTYISVNSTCFLLPNSQYPSASTVISHAQILWQIIAKERPHETRWPLVSHISCQGCDLAKGRVMGWKCHGKCHRQVADGVGLATYFGAPVLKACNGNAPMLVINQNISEYQIADCSTLVGNAKINPDLCWNNVN